MLLFKFLFDMDSVGHWYVQLTDENFMRSKCVKVEVVLIKIATTLNVHPFLSQAAISKFMQQDS